MLSKALDWLSLPLQIAIGVAFAPVIARVLAALHIL